MNHHPGKGFGIGRFVRRAASVASVAAKHAYAAASATRIPEEEMLPLNCCLMSVSLPWEQIAQDLLFKVRVHNSKIFWKKEYGTGVLVYSCTALNLNFQMDVLDLSLSLPNAADSCSEFLRAH